MARAVSPVESEGVEERAELNMFTNTCVIVCRYFLPKILHVKEHIVISPGEW